MNIGNPNAGATNDGTIAIDRVVVTAASLAENAYLAYVGAHIGADPANLVDATVRAVVYDGTDVLVQRSDELLLAPGVAIAWREFRFDAPLLAAGAYWVGLHVGGGIVTVSKTTLAAAHRRATDSYADGTASPLPSPSNQNTRLPVYGAVFDPWTVPLVEDAQLARLPWDVAQRVLGAGGSIARTKRSAVSGWHHTTTDPEVGAFCIVRTDGPLAELVGERLRIEYRAGNVRRAIAVYCHDEQAFPEEADDEDLSLPRRAFAALAPLARDAITVSVEVLS